MEYYSTVNEELSKLIIVILVLVNVLVISLYSEKCHVSLHESEVVV